VNHYWLKLDNPRRSMSGANQDLEAAMQLFERLEIDVLDGGLGAGASVWVVIRDSSASIAILRRKLGEVSRHIEIVEPIQYAAEGRTLARQLPLFH
jgi:hypothetical protein